MLVVIPAGFHLDQRAHPRMDAALEAVTAGGCRARALKATPRTRETELRATVLTWQWLGDEKESDDGKRDDGDS
ncbi:MAG: hypothetical protein ACT4PJ_12650 [Gemmatimonadaceae bacterium]